MNPRVGVVGSGPSGFYAAQALLAAGLAVDVLDRLPTPFGLVRAGVAPDHPRIKSVTRVFDKVAAEPGFRFLGNVEIGRDLTTQDLDACYDAVIYAYGARLGKLAGVRGEHLSGNTPAADVVGWYNGHPDHVDHVPNLSGRRAIVIGNGNVALDVTRMLASRVDRLETTDMAEPALRVLRSSNVEEIVVLGRRGPAESAFTHPELLELGSLQGVDVVVDADLSLEGECSEVVREKLATLREYAVRPTTPGNRRIVLKFCSSPVEIVGRDVVEAVRVRHTDGSESLLDASLVVHAVGYTGTPLEGLPFDLDTGTVPHDRGRVLAGDEPLTGHYVTGWIKRGPNGVIGTNRACAVETVHSLLDDVRLGRVPVRSREADVLALLEARAVEVVTYRGWQDIDAHEQERGRAAGRPRIKLTRVRELVAVAGGQG
ncbi:MAG TPA: FAD-dependent oxidoreductase [Nocardioidaceae bacterium]|nr:FAD-dependent oxidoreductase [Nocardioidaceae bacterium]